MPKINLHHTHIFTCMYICTCVHTHTFTCMHICTHTHIHLHVHMHTHIHLYVCIYVRTHTNSPACTYAHTHFHLYVHMHARALTCMYIHTHIHLHVHIHTCVCTHIHIYLSASWLHHRHRKLKDIAAPVEGASHVCSLWKEQNRGRTSPQHATKPVTWDPLQVHSDMTPYLASCLVPDDSLLGRHPFTSVDAGTRLWQDLVTGSGEPQTPWQPQNKFLKLEIISLYFILESSIIWVFSIDTIGNIKEAEAWNTRGIQKLWLNKTAGNSRCQRSKLKFEDNIFIYPIRNVCVSSTDG